MPATNDSHPFQNPTQILAWLEASHELFWSVDAEGRYTFVNGAWEALLGYKPTEMLGKRFVDFQFPETAARDAAAFVLHTQVPGPFRYETSFRKRDGGELHVLFSSHALIKDGRVIGWQGIGFDMTEKRKAEAALRLSETQLRSFITHAPTAIAMFDNDLHYLAYSDRWLEDYGLIGQNLVGRHHYDVFPSIRDNVFWKDVHRRCLAGESAKKDEDTFIGADGKQEWLRWDVRPWYLPTGGIGGILMLTESISGRRRAELELRASEERYRHLADMGFEAIFIHENDVVIEVNRALVELLGYADKDELIGKRGLEAVVAPQSRDLVIERLRGKSNHAIEIWCKRKNGELFLGETQARDIVYQGRPMRLVNIRDITARKKAEEAIAAEKERLAVTLQSIGDGVIATDTKGRVAIMNTVAERLTGWRQTEALGRPLGEVFRIIHEISREPCENPVDKVLATGEIIELANHTMLLSRGGEEYVIADSGAPIRDAEGRIIGVVLVFRDTTEKQKLIEAAQRTQKLESLGILAGGIAHDFNNLLGGIFGYIDLVHAKTKDEAQAYQLAKALATIDRARGLTQQLLTFAKGGAPIRKVARLFPFVQETVHFVLSGSAVTAHFQAAPDLKACNFDRNQIGQVIDNLVINAQQAMPLGGSLWVTAENLQLRAKQVEGLPAGEYAHIAIRDSGIGIPPEILPRIFDPFFTTKQKGSGLGLATCYSILKQHDGSIEVESESGRGTTFHLYLPVSAEQPEPEVKVAPAPTKAGKGLFVLMDDEEVIRETLGEMLGAQGFEVVTFVEGRAALDYLKSLPKLEAVAAIMLDLTVPGGMGGREAVVEIRKLSQAVPIFVSSGYAEDPVMAEPERYGVTGSLSKPFRRVELLALLAKHL